MIARLTQAWHPALLMVGLLAVLPIMSSIPLAAPSARFAMTASPLYVYTVGILLILSAWVATQDTWLGILSAWVGLSLLWTPTVNAFEASETFVLSACLLVVIQALPHARRPALVTALVVVGLFEVLYGVHQWIGYDVLWHGTKEIVPLQAIFGTTGNSNYYGVYLAMIAPLAPWWTVPFFLLGIVLSHSLLAVVAVSAGLLWRVRDQPRLVLIGLGLAVCGFAWVYGLKGETPLSGWGHRLAVWQLALSSLTPKGWLIGVGPGSWSLHIPGLQWAYQIYPSEVFLQGHNEWLQLLYENGLIAVLCLLGWLWAHRPAWTGPYGPALLATMVCSLGMFGFHLAMTGCVAVGILGLATAQETNL